MEARAISQKSFYGGYMKVKERCYVARGFIYLSVLFTSRNGELVIAQTARHQTLCLVP